MALALGVRIGVESDRRSVVCDELRWSYCIVWFPSATLIISRRASKARKSRDVKERKGGEFVCVSRNPSCSHTHDLVRSPLGVSLACLFGFQIWRG